MSTRNSQQFAMWSRMSGVLAFTLLFASAIALPSSSALGHSNLAGTPTAVNGKTGRIAFETDRDGNSEIYAMNPDGTNVVNLTNNGADDKQPAWSPDGTQIAFQSDRDGNLEIFLMNADGSNQRNLTANLNYDDAPDWSPDGRQIAFYSDRDKDLEVYVMDADGSNLRNLTNNAADEYSPAWQPVPKPSP